MPCLARPRWLVTALVALAVIATVAVFWTSAGAGPPSKFSATLSRSSVNANGKTRPNIVFVLTDDLSSNLVQHMPQVQKMQREGVSFSNYIVTDSLCCPSRSSIFTGKFPHDTGVYTNVAPDGGFPVFHGRGNEEHTYGTALQSSGYATAMMGKYLNGYTPTDKLGGTQPYVPPGWTEWDVSGKAYAEYRYNLNENHKIVHGGNAPADYLTDVLGERGASFIQRSAASRTPFSLEIATYAPHAPYTPAKRDLNKFPGLKAPRTPAYDQLPSNAPKWLANHGPLSRAQQDEIDTVYRKRVQSVQAVDRLIAKLRATLQASGVTDDTYFVFSSDNGYHLGEYRLAPGKQTAFDTDVHVPLVVVGPDVPAGVTRDEVAQNIDLAPTFDDLAGVAAPPDVDGHSLAPLLRGQKVANWRNATLVEHRGPDVARDDPDAQTAVAGTPTSYEALWTADYTYVQYADGEVEYYDRKADPYELRNIASALPPAQLASLRADVNRLASCHGGAACWAAGHVGGDL
jgi:N-acetylglucosamine-6-sulfatase